MLFSRDVFSFFSGFLLLLLIDLRDEEGHSSSESESCLDGFFEDEEDLVDFDLEGEEEEDLELGAMVSDIFSCLDPEVGKKLWLPDLLSRTKGGGD
ncbi:MAG: hypothetical protein CL912_12190 [Deltaproteobacteria bacterium]|nr:hypothetical protein [Deltaproteobacteria bacterium]|tara:strand:- start:1319 stop:1606 length:288 start_codon:yes stop_codon:yes gene_type:complete